MRLRNCSLFFDSNVRSKLDWICEVTTSVRSSTTGATGLVLTVIYFYLTCVSAFSSKIDTDFCRSHGTKFLEFTGILGAISLFLFREASDL